MGKKDSSRDKTPSSVFKVGAIALAFMIIGYQSSLFIHRAASLHIAALRDRPDTVFVYIPTDAASGYASLEMTPEDFASLIPPTGCPQSLCEQAPTDCSHPAGPSRSRGHGRPRSPESSPDSASPEAGGVVMIRKNAEHSPAVERERERTRRVETFRFNPNTVSVEDLMRLGFSEKQAMAIDSYRQKGGRFRRASDFAKSYVVADSVYERLKPFIDIPKLDINKADSAAFDALPGIGPYYAAKMVEYRERLGGYSFKEQLLDIWNFGSERYDGLSDLVVCSRPARPFRLWQMPEDSLRAHPYIRSWQAAHSVVLYRNSMPREQWTVAGLASAGIILPEDAEKLARCFIAPCCE